MPPVLNQTGLANIARAGLFARAPGIIDDASKNFIVGSQWFDNSVTPATVYVCVDNTTGAAQWKRIPPGAVGWIIGADMNSTADQAFNFAVPATARLSLRSIVATNGSISLTTAAGGVYPAASKGGTAIVANTQVFTALTGTAATKVNLTLASAANTTAYLATGIYLSLTTGQGAAATADLFIFADILSRG